MRVLAIPEDFRKDQYILQPILSALLEAAGKPKARVRVCTDPLLGGISQALRWERIVEILDRYRGMVDLFVLCVDRDGNQIVLHGVTLGAAAKVSHSLLLEVGCLRQWADWPEPGNFHPKESVGTHFRSTSLAFGLTYSFREKPSSVPWK